MRHDSFEKVVKRSWIKEANLESNMAALAGALIDWSKSCLGSAERRKKTLLARLDGIQRKMAEGVRGGLMKLETKLKRELEEVLDQEEIYWHQKSKE